MFIKQLCELNLSLRIYDILKEHVRQELKNNEDAGATNSAKMIKSEGVFEIIKKEVQVGADGKVTKADMTETLIEYCFMLLSNITAIDEG